MSCPYGYFWVQCMLEEVVIFSLLTTSEINSFWKGHNERLTQLAFVLYLVYPVLISITFGLQQNVIYVSSASLKVKGHIFNEGSPDWDSGFKMLCGRVQSTKSM